MAARNKKGFASKLAQVSYDHRKADQYLLKMKGSAEEMKGILEKLQVGKKKK
ncbi:MAG TPA: hypothetical protein IAA45_01175 [Candidatus Blautia gallistercoris]|uniref:Uncharacterized protein n=1 Tax=Candidatus Blautia gallistercoris TaxID=2838490 RepID=A0A9D1WG74_9FIRM|nr:hypothetical protein [Candidatus Blautia gallistercoris]